MFTTQEEFKDLNRPGKIVNLTVKTNGGSVTVAKRVGPDWVTVLTISGDGGGELRVDDAPIQITPIGGAAYTITRS